MKKLMVAVFTAALVTGCATPLTSQQESELKGYEGKGLAVKEKDPGTGAVLGILPGGGSFYTRNYGLGIVNLLFWPISVLWDPVSGYDGAESINYYATKAVVDTKKQKEMSVLDDSLTVGTVSKEEYVTKKHAIEDRYSPM